ncbi:hypothetical protein CYMTET_23830 [Cymbomonas tetramitiformis]|uniref:Uncharacterized protein n=1 Tax=Cymbomonas tetramitiformis TaxID=36881 RepID=A0AAE0FXK8_9CHLO|nr:hypothetical protein CYMTET_23830 [Cymbomonas tetramitiformis]
MRRQDEVVSTRDKLAVLDSQAAAEGLQTVAQVEDARSRVEEIETQLQELGRYAAQREAELREALEHECAERSALQGLVGDLEAQRSATGQELSLLRVKIGERDDMEEAVRDELKEELHTEVAQAHRISGLMARMLLESPDGSLTRSRIASPLHRTAGSSRFEKAIRQNFSPLVQPKSSMSLTMSSKTKNRTQLSPYR